jgi:CO/xanthine dehydrogenase Mo-binding subunit
VTATIEGTAQSARSDDRYIGRAVPRVEDGRLLQGRGLFTADVHLADVVEMAVLRSPYPHARIISVDVSAARQAAGVVAAISYQDVDGVLEPLPNFAPHRLLNARTPYPLAKDKVRYVGEPVAVVAAEDRYLAEDALDLVQVEYEALPAVSDANQGLAPDAALLYEELGSNVAATFTRAVGNVDEAMSKAEFVLKLQLAFPRASGQPIEPRAIVAQPQRDRCGVSLTIWDTTQMPHLIRSEFSRTFGLDDEAVHVIAPDIGGGFGTKMQMYSEEFLVPYLALKLNRPVRWVEDRHENLLTSYQSRQQLHKLEVGFARDGQLLAIRDRVVADQGAHTPYGMIVPFNTTSGLLGIYSVPAFEAVVQVVYTNKPGMAPYRSGGGPPAAWVLERIMDAGARALDLDPVEIRRRNLPDPSEFPRASGLADRDGTPITYDSGLFLPCLEHAVAAVDFASWRAEQARRRQAGRRPIGMGVAVYRESGGRGFESAMVRVQPSGRVLVATGATPQGQGLETTLAQVCADRLGVLLEQVQVVTGDTAAVPLGMGTYGSRSAVLAGNAVAQAATQVRARALAAAATLLEVDPADLELRDGAISVRGAPDRQLSLAQLARTLSAPSPAMAFPKHLSPGLEATICFVQEDGSTSGGGAHAAVVEVDPETGQVTILRYVVAHDCGRPINPAIVAGQVQGAVAQGLGTALLEDAAYGEDGQPLAASFMDYLLPGALDVPSIEQIHVNAPSTRNPEGFKPVGEGGTVPAPAVIASAIDDALRTTAITRAPMTPAYLRSLLDQAGDSG